ncbi:hypothetical protein EBU24_01095 [bacterium]|nr:hypothetical protein [bacterium]
MGAEFYSDAAINLLLGTFAQESHLGKWRKQIKGPALGICQCERATFDWLKKKYPKFIKSEFEMIENDDSLAIIVTRLRYYTILDPLPEANDLPKLAKYWKDFYNTKYGKGTVEEFISNYRRLVA